jgi:hypothetical protein
MAKQISSFLIVVMTITVGIFNTLTDNHSFMDRTTPSFQIAKPHGDPFSSRSKDHDIDVKVYRKNLRVHDIDLIN